MTSHVLKRFEEAFKARHDEARKLKSEGKRLIGWICTYVPEEVIIAAGLIPVRVSAGLGDTPRANAYLPTNTCSTMKGCLDTALAKTYDYLEGVVFTNSCDNMGRCYDIWQLHSGYPYLHFINTPHSKRETAFKVMLHELRRFKDSLERSFKVSIGEDKLREAVKLMNEERRILSKIYEMRAEDPPPLTGVQSFYVVASAMSTPKERHLEMLKTLLEEPPKPQSDVKGRPRILVSGSFVDDEARLIDLIESSGGLVVADDLCSGSRYFHTLVEEDGKPLEAIARRYINRVPCPFVEHYEDRLNYVKELVKRFNVHGVIIYGVKFCDVHLFDAPILVEELRGMGVPAMFLEWSHTEVEWAPLKTRVEAFLETLR